MEALVPTSDTEKEPPDKVILRTAKHKVNLPRDPHLRDETLHRPILESGVEMHQMACGTSLWQQACPRHLRIRHFYSPLCW